MPPGGSDTLTRRLVGRVESSFLHQFVDRRKELRFLSLHKELLMLVGSVGQQKTSARRNLERSRGVLVRTDFAEQAQADARSGQCPGIIVTIDFAALKSRGQGRIAVNSEAFASRQLAQNDLAARCPATVSEKVPISAPHLETHPDARHGCQKFLAARLPAPEKADVTGPLRIS